MFVHRIGGSIIHQSRTFLLATICVVGMLGHHVGPALRGVETGEIRHGVDLRLAPARREEAAEWTCGGGAGVVGEVRRLLPSEWGVPHPAGIAYSASQNQLILLGETSPESNQHEATVVVITPYEDFVGAVGVDFEPDDAINIAFNELADALLLLSVDQMEIGTVTVGQDGVPLANTLEPVDISELGLRRAEGMGVDAKSEQLFILDSAALEVISVDLDDNFALSARIDLAHLNAGALRGMAVHPSTGHLFVANVTEAALYELTPAGALVNVYDMAKLDRIDVRGMGFGPSADLTDDEDTIHLFIADSNSSENGDGDRDAKYGSIREVAIYSGRSPYCPTTVRFLPRRR